MQELLSGEVAVITGGASGIGRAIALAFADHGADVVIGDLRSDPRGGGRPTHEVIEEESDADAAYVECDVSEVGSIEETVARAGRFGGVDVMVNNAGIYWRKPFLEIDESEFDAMVDVNLKGVFFGAQAAARRMVEDGGGTIINMSSIAGIRGSFEETTYSATKGAVTVLTYALANELGPKGIRVNALHPGLVRTTLTTEDVPHIEDEVDEQMWKEEIPIGEIAEPEDVANAATMLASEYAEYITGDSLLVDGGITNTL